MAAGASPLTIFLLDDHNLFRKGLTNIIDSMGTDYRIIGEAGEGQGLVDYLQNGGAVPDILILDINMPGMDGFATIAFLNEHFPEIKVLVVSMIEKEETILRMLKAGAKGYLSKDVETSVLREALHAIREKGYYYTDFLTGRLVHQLQREQTLKNTIELNSRELEILKLACTELTYKEIAQQLFLSIKTIDTYRDSLFRKIGASSRVGLVIYAIRNNIVQV